MSKKCNYCVNKTQCEKCKNTDKFIPSEEVRHYFQRIYVGVSGIGGYEYMWNSTNKDLVPTQHIEIDRDDYCPYCGEIMYPIQGFLAQGIENYTVTGSCCLCQGARDELEYKQKENELKKKHEEELYKLQQAYKDKLVYCTDKLLDIKQKKERHNYEFFSQHQKYNLFNSPNPDEKKIFG